MFEAGNVQFGIISNSSRQEAAERFAAREQIFGLGAVRRRTVERHFGDLVIGDRNFKAPAKFAQLFFIHLLLLVRNIAAFPGFAQAVAFDGVSKDDSRLAFVGGSGFVGGVILDRIMTTASQFANLIVREVVHQREKLGILAEEMFARVAAGLDRIFLEVAVHAFSHAFDQQAGLIA